ncbi:MAG TPA: hypothetical protein VNX21_07760 [Candidatus Thermoplasmatota archaeon]|nr:hypothetical protein [Candidatus Thermoplasmatota archaeon]
MATPPANAPKPGKPGDQPTNVPEPSNTRPPAQPTPSQPQKPLTGEDVDKPQPGEPQDEQDKNEIKGM